MAIEDEQDGEEEELDEVEVTTRQFRQAVGCFAIIIVLLLVYFFADDIGQLMMDLTDGWLR